MLLMIGMVVAADAVTASPEQALRERVQARWDALIQRDFPTAYQFETPAYRDLYTEEDYLRGFGSTVIWEKAAVEQLAVDEEDAASVQVQLQYTIPEYAVRGLPGVTSRVTERWIQVDGEWWHVPEPR